MMFLLVVTDGEVSKRGILIEYGDVLHIERARSGYLYIYLYSYYDDTVNTNKEFLAPINP